MTTSSTARTHTKKVNLRSVALPAEHGGWGFLLEPILLGLILVPTLAGFWFALAMLAVFLLHQPLKVAVKDLQKHKLSERGQWGLRFVALYGLVALVCAILLFVGQNHDFLIAVAIMIPLILLQAYYDFRSQSRALWAELAGAGALGGTAAAIVLLADWQVLPAFALWVALLGRTIPSILYVRAKLRSQRGETFNQVVVYGSHLAAIGIVLLLAFVGSLPWLSVLALALLLIRAWVSLHDTRPIRASRVGMQEMIAGLLTVLLIAAGILLKL
jgi:hypothetical protein